MGRPRQTRLGVTWIDLVVVLAVGVLLVPLVVPVLRDASEQARVGKCLANLGALMAATGMYISDYAEFPFWAEGTPCICTWSYGGQTSDEYWRTPSGGCFYCPVTTRPLNAYLLGAQVQPDLYAEGQLVQRTPIPPLRCPSDRYSHQRMFWSGDDVLAESCYDDVGTSYQYNFHAISPGCCGGDLYWNGEPADPWNGPGSWSDVGRVLIQQVLARHSASFTMFLEDPMDWALNQHTLEVGNHGELGKHSVGYLDGHADYVFRDTRGWCGVGWEAINPDWVRNVFSDPPRPVAYGDFFINCNPPYGVALGK